MTTAASGIQRISACDGVTVAFSCPQFRKNVELQVWLLDSADQDPETGTLLAEGANYAIGGVPMAGTATVTTAIAYPAGKFLCRRRATSRAQQVVVSANKGVPSATQQDALDRAALVDEEIEAAFTAFESSANDLFGRALRFKHGQSTPELDKPSFAGKFFAGGAGGDVVPASGTGNDAALRADLAQPNGYQLVGGIRKKLAANLTYYVNSATGSDASDGLTLGTALQTAQKAIAKAYTELDINGYQVTISLAAGTHTAPIKVFGRLIGDWDYGGKPLQIIGDEGNPDNVVLAMVSNSAVTAQNRSYVLLAGVTVTVTIGGYGLVAYDHATIEHRNCKLGAIFADALIAQFHSDIRAIGPTWITGNANSLIHCTSKSRITFTSQTITFVGTRTFATYLYGLNDGTLALDQATFIGPRPNGNTLVHNLSILNAYSHGNVYHAVNNPNGGWGFLGVGTYAVEDASIVTADGYKDRTFYVRSTASGNQNDGLEDTDARAFKTITACVDFIAALPFNPANFNAADGVKIRVADGTYNETVHLRDVKYFDATLIGNTAAPANVIVNGVDDGMSKLAGGTKWTVKGFTINAASGSDIRGERGAQIDFQNIVFGTATQNHIHAASTAAIVATGPYTFGGGAAPRHVLADGGRVNLSVAAVTVTGTPNFASETIRVSNGGAVKSALSWTGGGGVTGKRYTLLTGSTLDTAGAGGASVPGSVAGTVSAASEVA